MKGIKPIDQQKANKPAEDTNKDTKIFKIPATSFEEFKDINEYNQDMFMFTAYQIVIEYLEAVCLKPKFSQPDPKEGEPAPDQLQCNWDVALEFPEIIPTMGRSKLHEVANYFQFAHHTSGPRNKTASQSRIRKFVIYPKTLFVDKQQKEKKRLLADRQKIREKYQKREQFTGIFPDQPSTFTEMCIREVFEDKFLKDKPYDHVPQHDDDFNPRIIKTNMLDQEAIGQAPDH